MLLIVGRTSTGKDSLKDILKDKYQWTFVQSTTTRPKRTKDETTHRFITQEEADRIPVSERIAPTEIAGNLYFATKTDITNADAYIIDPNGVEDVLTNMPDMDFDILYMSPSDPSVQREMALKRSDSPEHEAKIFEKRIADEAAQFDKFEKMLDDGSLESRPNCTQVIRFTNDYGFANLEHLAIRLELNKRFAENMCSVINSLIKEGVIECSENGDPLITANNKKTPVRIALLTEMLKTDHANLGTLMYHWLQLKDPVL